MIKVDENEPIGEVDLSFPYRDVKIKRYTDPKDEYTLEEEIGRGKFGTVYKCTEKATGLNLAAKYIACPKKEDRRNVEREIDIMRELQHPRLIQIYDAFENGKIMCVILELIEGGELFERVIDDDFILTEKACTIFMRQICEGIDFIHSQKILHLDMKPENILCLTKTGNRIKIIDFGLARKFDPNKKLQVLFGTPEFVAPEVVNFDEIGYGTDMWSVGVICYVLLSGLSPFMGSTDVETMSNVTIGKYDFDDEAFEQISENAKDFIKKLLVKDLNERLTAKKCLLHPWLMRKKLPARNSSMDMTKDNLKQFVERWNEHPNSPYVFEIGENNCSEGTSSNSDSHSLIADSPSPCGSLASSIESLNENINNNSLFVPNSEPFRRASDSSCFVSKPDISDRLNLADEIKKLSDKLHQLSSIDANFESSHINNSSGIVLNKHKEITVVSSNKNKISNGFMSKVLPKDHPENPNCNVPWRRTKFRIGTSSRDVPLCSKNKHINNVSCENNQSMSGEDNNINDTKDLLLQLLEHWDESNQQKCEKIRHSSISSDWSENDTLGQRTISSLNTFFQKRATNKKLTKFHFNKT